MERIAAPFDYRSWRGCRTARGRAAPWKRLGVTGPKAGGIEAGRPSTVRYGSAGRHREMNSSYFWPGCRSMVATRLKLNSKR